MIDTVLCARTYSRVQGCVISCQEFSFLDHTQVSTLNTGLSPPALRHCQLCNTGACDTGGLFSPMLKILTMRFFVFFWFFSDKYSKTWV